MINLRFRDALPSAVLGEFENIANKVKGFLGVEHNDDGTHGDVTANSLTLQGATVGELVDLPYNATRYVATGAGSWVVSSGDQVYLRVSRIGQLAWVEFWVQTTVTLDAVATDLVIRLPELHPLRAIVDASSTLGAQHTGGSFQWVDTAAGTAGSGYIIVVTVSSGGYQAAQLRLVKHDVASFAVSANLMVRGSVMFPLNPENAVIPF